jgi:hypothetical protein
MDHNWPCTIEKCNIIHLTQYFLNSTSFKRQIQQLYSALDKGKGVPKTKPFSFSQFERLRSRKGQHFNRRLHYELTLIIRAEVRKSEMTRRIGKHLC